MDPAAAEELLKIEHKHRGCGPQTGIFTDGGSAPNPGAGGWGVVCVVEGRVVWRARGGSAEPTTNNRMELQAVVEALERTVPGENSVLFSDSTLAVQTLTLWATKWEAAGWVRPKNGLVANKDLVVRAFELFKARPGITIKWIKVKTKRKRVVVVLISECFFLI